MSLPLPLDAFQGPAHRIGGGKPPHPKVNCDKENETQLKGTPLSGALLTPASPQCNVSLNSVASTYSDFVVIDHFVFMFCLPFSPPCFPTLALNMWRVTKFDTLV